jgi:UDP-N-acetylglucosamine--N-acetylmuramyl-(pentapeptide) pyrophosphoryl-undecaprenol N-acetylglucosamine transferase
MKVVLTGGGTGGHIFPLVAVARKLKEKLVLDVDFLYIGSGNKLEKDVMEKEGIKAKYIVSGKMRRYFSFQNAIDFFKVPIGFVQSLWILLRYMPDVIFSKGGYVAVPVILAGWLYRIPILIHESDAVPGYANQLLEKFSKRVVIAYPSAQAYFEKSKTALFGNPVRDDISQGDKEAGRKFFNFTESKQTILVMGGSQGSKIINKAIIKILPKLLMRFQVIHQTGEESYEEMVHLAAEFGIKAGHEGYYPIKFLDGDVLKNAYALADLVISRAGANTISEIAANKKACILIPLDNSANDHQRMNAYDIAKIGGAMVLEETNLGEHIFLEKIEKIFDDENLKNSMAENIKVFYHPQAAENIAAGLIEIADKLED